MEISIHSKKLGKPNKIEKTLDKAAQLLTDYDASRLELAELKTQKYKSGQYLIKE